MLYEYCIKSHLTYIVTATAQSTWSIWMPRNVKDRLKLLWNIQFLREIQQTKWIHSNTYNSPGCAHCFFFISPHHPLAPDLLPFVLGQPFLGRIPPSGQGQRFWPVPLPAIEWPFPQGRRPPYRLPARPFYSICPWAAPTWPFKGHTVSSDWQ